MNALLGLTKITASVEESLKKSCIEWIAASAPAFKPFAVCNGPGHCCMLSFSIQLIAFPVTFLKTLPIPMGLTLEFLLNGITCS